MMFIAYDIKTHVIWGFGQTPKEAWDDAAIEWFKATDSHDVRKFMTVAPATEELIQYCCDYGGGEMADNWTFRDGVADITQHFREDMENLNRYYDAKENEPWGKSGETE